MAKQQVEANITASPSAETNTTENQPQEEKKTGSSVGILKILQDKGLITEDQIKAAATQARATGDSVVDVLIKMNFVSESVIHNIFEKSEEDENASKSIAEVQIDRELISKIPINFAKENLVIPFAEKKNCIYVASSNPYDIVLIDQLSMFFEGKKIKMVANKETDLRQAIDKFYGKASDTMTLTQVMSEMELNVNNQTSNDAKNEDSPIVKFVNVLFYEAIKAGASDIHIEPDDLFVRIRLRIDGVLMNKVILHKNYWSGLCVRLKVLSGMNIAESRKPQDGGISMVIQGREVDFRVSNIPTIYGENIVIRILDKSHNLATLDSLGFSEKNLKLIELALDKPEGILIVTGPTGSGKTTTLYSILDMVNDIQDNIMTLEDPVEYRLPIIRQSEINHKAGFDFASGLRSLLRQDPDVIFLGEIRDQETAEIAIRASITGHQVFSTLHTNNAILAINRLIDMGIPSYMVSSTLSAVIAQRLVRKLCPHCKKAVPMSNAMKKGFGLDPAKEYTIFEPEGCSKCGQNGYKGRVVVSEVLFVDEEMNMLISGNPTTREVTELAKKQGFKSMQQDGILKMIKGITSWDEVKRAIDMTEYTKRMEG